MKCEVCREFEATFLIFKGKRGTNPIIWLECIHICELCLIDYGDEFKRLDIPYNVKVIREVVTFT